jgi:hypothetical protein
MTKRERVKAAFAFQKADRIPRYDIFLPEFQQIWKRERTMPESANIYDSYPKIDIGDIICDARGPLFPQDRILKREGDEYYEIDTWGRTMFKRDGAYFHRVVDTVLNDRSKLDSLEFTSLVSDNTARSFARAAARTEERFAPVSGVMGLFNACSCMRGDEVFLLDLAEDPAFVKALVERLVPHVLETGWQAIEATGTQDTAIWYYDEYSSRLGPLFSPKSFGEIFVPAMKHIFSVWKSRGAQNIVLHCDGNSLPLLDLLIESGITAIQSMAPTAGMWLPDVQKLSRGKLTLIGGMCNMTTLAKGTHAEIRREAEAIAEAGRAGGVIIGTHSIGDDVPVENYDYYYSVMEEIDSAWS